MYANVNQTTRPNRVSSWTDDALTSVVSDAELAAFLGVDESDTLLSGMALTATDAISRFTNIELVNRKWNYRMDFYPSRQSAMTGIGAIPNLSDWWVQLPKSPVTDVHGDHEHDIHTGRVWPVNQDWPLTIEYDAGYTENTLPAALKQAVLMMAGFMYDHRGACDVTSAGEQSGAFALARPFRRLAGGL